MEITLSTVLSKTKLSKKEKNFYAKLPCKFCKEPIGLHRPMYYLNGEAFHDECELDHLLNPKPESIGSKKPPKGQESLKL